MWKTHTFLRIHVHQKNFKLLISLLFSAKEEHEVKDGVYIYHPLLLDCAPMEKVGGWSLEQEDPLLFTEERLWKGGRREWEDIPLPGHMPPGAGIAGGSGAKPKPTSTPDEDDPSRRGPYHPPEEQTKQLLEIHHSLTKLLQTMGVDPCKEYENSKLENILEKISSADLACRVCGKVYSSSSRMKNHFRKRHLGKTKHQCKICKKYYTDPGSLRVHEASHDTSKNPFSCGKCTKTFPTKAQLHMHGPVHDQPLYQCAFTPQGCDKKYKWMKGRREHEAKCEFNPDLPKEPPYKCPAEGCKKGYWDHRSLLRHYRGYPTHNPKK